MTQTISPQELAGLRQANKKLDLIDVRTPVEFREVHVEFARNIPLDRLDPQALLAERSNKPDQPVYVVCRSGNRANQACEKLAAAGIANAINVSGGTIACEAAGLPLVRGKKSMSLERQVRIAAGFLVLVGAILAIAVHPYFAGLSAFVGAGLMFAGITDTCGMGMLLARMPWNQVKDSTGSTGSACRVGLFLFGLLLINPTLTQAQDHTTDTVATVRRNLAERKAVLIDVREKQEWDAGHLSDARHLPLSALEKGVDPKALAQLIPQDNAVYLHCASGGRCLQAATLLKEQGYDVRPLKPGYKELLGTGLPASQR